MQLKIPGDTGNSRPRRVSRPPGRDAPISPQGISALAEYPFVLNSAQLHHEHFLEIR
ncbi:MAG: hypothetical protein LBS59_02115 [Puniceicoccales bacterium]|nr:hypothetical protein [Puniceicoccales bacterium]